MVERLHERRKYCFVFMAARVDFTSKIWLLLRCFVFFFSIAWSLRFKFCGFSDIGYKFTRELRSWIFHVFTSVDPTTMNRNEAADTCARVWCFCTFAQARYSCDRDLATSRACSLQKSNRTSVDISFVKEKHPSIVESARDFNICTRLASPTDCLTLPSLSTYSAVAFWCLHVLSFLRINSQTLGSRIF